MSVEEPVIEVKAEPVADAPAVTESKPITETAADGTHAPEEVRKLAEQVTWKQRLAELFKNLSIVLRQHTPDDKSEVLHAEHEEALYDQVSETLTRLEDGERERIQNVQKIEKEIRTTTSERETVTAAQNLAQVGLSVLAAKDVLKKEVQTLAKQEETNRNTANAMQEKAGLVQETLASQIYARSPWFRIPVVSFVASNFGPLQRSIKSNADESAKKHMAALSERLARPIEPGSKRNETPAYAYLEKHKLAGAALHPHIRSYMKDCEAIHLSTAAIKDTAQKQRMIGIIAHPFEADTFAVNSTNAEAAYNAQLTSLEAMIAGEKERSNGRSLLESKLKEAQNTLQKGVDPVALEKLSPATRNLLETLGSGKLGQIQLRDLDNRLKDKGLQDSLTKDIRFLADEGATLDKNLHSLNKTLGESRNGLMDYRNQKRDIIGRLSEFFRLDKNGGVERVGPTAQLEKAIEDANNIANAPMQKSHVFAPVQQAQQFVSDAVSGVAQAVEDVTGALAQQMAAVQDKMSAVLGR